MHISYGIPICFKFVNQKVKFHYQANKSMYFLKEACTVNLLIVEMIDVLILSAKFVGKCLKCFVHVVKAHTGDIFYYSIV